MKSIKHFNVGDIVTLISHPLFTKKPKKINEHPEQVPPLMLIKEVLFEKKETKKVFSEEIEGAQIADFIKYVCVYFNSNKSEFIEKIIYHSFLKSYKEMKYYREKNEKDNTKFEKDLISEVSSYKNVSKYKFGKMIQFKTKKLENRKSYNGSKSMKIVNSFQTPNFILSGVKKNEQIDLFYSDGKTKKIVDKQLYKVMWFNHFQQKFSEQYLPKEFFVQGLEL